MKKNIKIVIFIIICIILVTVFGILLFKYLKEKDKQKQIDSITNFFSYINSRDYEKMYEMITDSSKENISKEDFITRNKNIYEGIDASNVEINISGISKQENKNEYIVYYNEELYTAAGELSFVNDLKLVKENKNYKINWNSKVIFPELEENYKVRISTIHALRGSILDRNGKELAYDGKIYQVGIVPGKLGENRDENISKISELTEVSIERINKLLSASYVKDDTFVAIKKISKSNEELKQKLLEIPGVMLSNIDGRIYALGEEAGHLIGYVQTINEEELKSHEGQNYTTTSLIGKSGLEYYYEQTLRGIDGSEIYIEDSNGNKVKNILFQEKKDGQNITTTIDFELQQKFYNEIKDDKGLFVVMQPEIGAILALVSTPSYNSNDFVLGMTNEKWESLNNDENKPLYNRFKQSYCPGSTFKPITAAIGLTEKVIDENTELNYSGTSWQKDSSWGNYFVTTLTAYNEKKTVKNAIIRSDNIFFARLALEIGENKFEEGLKNIGFGEDIDFPITLKKSQYLNKDAKFTDVKLASSGYGQGDILVNPVHMASIYSAFVNNGKMVKPYLEFKNNKVEYLKDDVFSADAINTVKDALFNVVNSSAGTASDAKIEGITLLGKTGTAELKTSKDDTESGTLGWFNCITEGRKDEELLIVGMVENEQNNASGGSHYVISKIKDVLSK